MCDYMTGFMKKFKTLPLIENMNQVLQHLGVLQVNISKS